MKNNMKDSMKIETRKQAELISDPICLTIINYIEEEAYTKENIAKNIEEDYTLISQYIDELYKNNILNVIQKDGKKKFHKSAISYKMGSWDNNFDGNIYNHWVLGLIHHLESNLTDLLKILSDRDKDKFLKDLGYYDNVFNISKVYLDQDEVEELQELINDFIKKHKKTDEKSDEKRPYEMALILNPDLPFIKKQID